MDIYQKNFPTVGKTVIASNKKMQGKYVCFMSASFSNQNLQKKLVCLYVTQAHEKAYLTSISIHKP